MSLFLTTAFVFGFVMFIMAIGVIFGNRQIQGSCGGEEGCEICFFKHGDKCDKKKLCEGKSGLTGNCESIDSDASCLVEESLSETGK